MTSLQLFASSPMATNMKLPMLRWRLEAEALLILKLSCLSVLFMKLFLAVMYVRVACVVHSSALKSEVPISPLRQIWQ